MAKNIYTLQHYKMNINGEETWSFEIKTYSTYANILHSWGKSICKGLEPCIEEFIPSKKEAFERKKDMGEYMLGTGRKLWNYQKLGMHRDYNWEYDETERSYIGTPKEV